MGETSQQSKEIKANIEKPGIPIQRAVEEIEEKNKKSQDFYNDELSKNKQLMALNLQNHESDLESKSKELWDLKKYRY